MINAVGYVRMAKPVTAVSEFYERTRTPNVSESWNSRPRQARSDCRGTAQMNKKSNSEITPLAGKDLEIIRHFMGLGPKIGPSLVRFDENDRILVIEGPLKGFEGSIIKVDRRKQRAKIRVDFAGSSHTMDLSFEDIEKG